MLLKFTKHLINRLNYPSIHQFDVLIKLIFVLGVKNAKLDANIRKSTYSLCRFVVHH